MNGKRIPQGLKNTFLVHGILSLIFGATLFIAPKAFGQITGWPINSPTIYQLLGVFLLAFSASSLLSYKENLLEKVKIVLQMEIVLTVLGALVMLLGIILTQVPLIAWLYLIIFIAFAVAFIYFYRK